MKPTYTMGIISCEVASLLSAVAILAALLGEWAVWWTLIGLAVVLMVWPFAYDEKWGLAL